MYTELAKFDWIRAFEKKFVDKNQGRHKGKVLEETEKEKRLKN